MSATTNVPTIAGASQPATISELRDIKPPVEIPSGWEWLWWVLAGLALLLAVIALWKWRQKRQAQIPTVPPVPAHVRAKQKLQEALALIEQPKPFVSAVSDAARYYLEERFEFHAPERTTEEFLHELQRTDLLTRDQKDSLGGFLQRCDLVKFAKHEPREPELRDLHGSAVRLVDETEPENQAMQTPPDQFTSQPRLEVQPTNDFNTKSTGHKFAVIGTLLQGVPGLALLAYLGTIVHGYASVLRRPILNPEALGSIPSQILSIYRDAIVAMAICWGVGMVGVLLLAYALVWKRYREEWFFWFLVIYGFIAFGVFPFFGIPVGLFFIVYCLTKRSEFLKHT